MPTQSTSERSDAASTGGGCLLLVRPDQPPELRTERGPCSHWRSDANPAQSSDLSIDGVQVSGFTAENGIAPLFFASKGGAIAVASDPIRPARALGLPLAADDHFFADHFSLRRLPTQNSPVQGVAVIAPGTHLDISSRGIDQRRLLPDRPRTLSRGSFAEHVSVCRQKLDLAIRSATQDDPEPCVQLSGGIDSLLLVRRLKSMGYAPQAVSWSLRQFADADEGDLVSQRCREEGVPLRLLDLSHCWPGRNLVGHQDALWPVHNAYAGLIEHMRKLTAESGGGILLNGDGADSLLDADRYRLADALRLANGPHMWREGMAALTNRKPWKEPRIRALAQWAGRRPKPMIGDWLSDAAAQSTRQRSDAMFEWPHPEQARGAINLSGLPSWSAHDPQSPVRMALPYRDPDLIATMLRIPAHHLLNRDGSKRLPHALAKTRPEQFVARTGLLTAFFDYGIFDRERDQVRAILFHGGERWPRYVKRAFIERVIRQPETHRPIEKLVLWLCVCLELWLERLTATDQGLSWL